MNFTYLWLIYNSNIAAFPIKAQVLRNKLKFNTINALFIVPRQRKNKYNFLKYKLTNDAKNKSKQKKTIHQKTKRYKLIKLIYELT